jgi:hypothetical protein
MRRQGAAMANSSEVLPSSKVPIRLKLAGMLFRSLFLIVLIVVTARISLPETLNSGTLAHFALADFARMAIGITVCVFLFVQLFRRPIDDNGYKVWSYIGLALTSLLLLVLALKSGLLIGI